MKITLLVISTVLNFKQDPQTLEKQKITYKSVEYISMEPCDTLEKDYEDVKVYYDVPDIEINIDK